MIPLVSELNSVENFGDLVRAFVDSLPSKVNAVKSAVESDPSKAVALLHKLQGSAGGYGYPAICAVAEALETKVKNGKKLADVLPDFDQLEELVGRALLGLPSSSSSQDH